MGKRKNNFEKNRLVLHCKLTSALHKRYITQFYYRQMNFSSNERSLSEFRMPAIM